MTTHPRPEPPVPIAPAHRRSWRTLWRRCSCGLTEPCVDRITTSLPTSDRAARPSAAPTAEPVAARSESASGSAAARSAATIQPRPAPLSEPLIAPAAAPPRQLTRVRAAAFPKPSTAPPTAAPPSQPGPLRAAACSGPSAPSPAAALSGPPFRRRSVTPSGPWPAASAAGSTSPRSEEDMFLQPGPRHRRSPDAGRGRAGGLTPGQAMRARASTHSPSVRRYVTPSFAGLPDSPGLAGEPASSPFVRKRQRVMPGVRA